MIRFKHFQRSNRSEFDELEHLKSRSPLTTKVDKQLVHTAAKCYDQHALQANSPEAPKEITAMLNYESATIAEDLHMNSNALRVLRAPMPQKIDKQLAHMAVSYNDQEARHTNAKTAP